MGSHQLTRACAAQDARAHEQLLFLLGNDLLVPARAFPQALDLVPEPPQLVALLAPALLCLAQVVRKRKQSLSVRRLDLVLLGKLDARLGELRLERRDERCPDGVPGGVRELDSDWAGPQDGAYSAPEPCDAPSNVPLDADALSSAWLRSLRMIVCCASRRYASAKGAPAFSARSRSMSAARIESSGDDMAQDKGAARPG